MVSKYSHNSLLWIDLESPKKEELVYVIEEYSIPLEIEQEIRFKNIEYKTKLYSGFIFVSLDFPYISNSENKISSNKIIFIINNNFIITIHSEPIEALKEFLKNLEMDTTLPEELKIKNNGLLFFYLIKNLYIDLKEKLIIEKANLKEISDKVIENKQKDISKIIYKKNHILIKLDQCLNFHKRILETLPSFLIRIFGEQFEYYTNTIVKEYSETRTLLDQQERNFANLYNFSNLIIINKNNKKLRLLTRLSILSLLIALLTFLYVFSNI